MKTMTDKVRAHALSSRGMRPFTHAASRLVMQVLLDHLRDMSENSMDMSSVERRMFCLFVAEALESK